MNDSTRMNPATLSDALDVIADLVAERDEWRAYAIAAGKELAALRVKAKKAEAEKAPSAVPTPGFDAFWAAWPPSHRKANKKACLKAWSSAGLESIAGDVVEHVKCMKASRDWTKEGGAYIPAPLVYLRQERYKAPPPASHYAGKVNGIVYKQEGINDDGSFY